jgi:hypothetical protein
LIALRYIFAFLFWLQALSLAAQNGFEAGFILLNSGDTLFGHVKDRNDGFRPKLLRKIQLKTDGPIKRCARKDIREYRIGDKTYERFFLKISQTFPREEYTISENKGELQFLRVIVRGKLSYYHMESYDPESGVLDEVDLVKLSGDQKLVRASQGLLGLKKKALSAYLYDYPEFVERIMKNEFKRALELVQEFNTTQ